MPNYSVNWPLGDSSWKDTTDEIKRDTGISHYALYKQSFPRFFIYALKIYVVDGGSGAGRSYKFDDQSGDEYALNVFTDRSHYVCFDFDGKPEITSLLSYHLSLLTY